MPPPPTHEMLPQCDERFESIRNEAQIHLEANDREHQVIEHKLDKIIEGIDNHLAHRLAWSSKVIYGGLGAIGAALLWVTQQLVVWAITGR